MAVLTMDEMIERAQQTEIASLGIVVNRIIQVIQNPRSNAMDLKALIEIDPALSAAILRRANSAFYGVKRKLSNIMDAIVCIGFDTIKELALNQKVSQIFKKDVLIHGYSRQHLWLHSLSVALTGKFIFRREFRMRGDDIYTAGILHDLGIMVLDQFLGDDYLPVLRQVEQGVNLSAAESELLGFNHEELTLGLLRSWSLPEEFCVVVGQCENPRQVWGEEAKLGQTLFVSNFASQKNQLGYIESPQASREHYTNCLSELNLSDLGIKVIMDEVRQELQKMKDDGWFN